MILNSETLLLTKGKTMDILLICGVATAGALVFTAWLMTFAK